jgi:hypothetical protein
MSAKKELKRAVKAVWDEVKALRTERGKLYAPGDIVASADALAQNAAKLRDLSQKLSALNAMPPESAAPKPRRRKAKT